MDLRTSITLPDETFASAEVLARRLGLSREALYALAIAEFVETHRRYCAAERLDVVQGRRTAVVGHVARAIPLSTPRAVEA